MADIFLSYKREDRAQVAPLAAALEAEGFNVWWDPELPLGQSYATSITCELQAAKVIMPVWTARSIVSEYVQEEATVGKRRRNLIPARLEAVDPPIGFSMVQAADLCDWRPGDRAHPEFLNLLEAVRALVQGRAPNWPASATPEATQASRKLGFARRGALAALAMALAVATGSGIYAFYSWQKDRHIQGWETKWEGNLTRDQLDRVLAFLCIEPGKTFSDRETRAGIRVYEQFVMAGAGGSKPDGRIDDVQGQDLIVLMAGLGPCDTRKYENFFERRTFDKPELLRAAKMLLNKKLETFGEFGRVSDGDEIDPQTRDAIAALIFKVPKLSRGDVNLDRQFTDALVEEIGGAE